MHTPAEQVHVSRNRLEGSLGDTPLERLLEECRKHMVTGEIRVTGGDGPGLVQLRVGYVDSASYGDLSDDDAVAALQLLSDGDYELVQRLPDLAGDLGDAAQFTGATDDLPLVKLMQHCEDNALSCTITIISDFDRGQIVYRAGEIIEVELNGRRDDDKIVDMVRFRDARFRVTAPPLDLAISGWPSVRSEPTAPFKIEGATEPPAPKRAERVEPVEVEVEAEEPEQDEPERDPEGTEYLAAAPPRTDVLGAIALGAALSVLLAAIGFAATLAWTTFHP